MNRESERNFFICNWRLPGARESGNNAIFPIKSVVAFHRKKRILSLSLSLSLSLEAFHLHFFGFVFGPRVEKLREILFTNYMRKQFVQKPSCIQTIMKGRQNIFLHALNLS